MSNYFYSFDEFNKHIDSIVNQIKTSDEKFDLIAGIYRGGVIPAQTLAYKLDLPCQFFKWQVAAEIRDRGSVDLLASLALHDGKKILVVDDISDSGKTLSEITGRIGAYYSRVGLDNILAPGCIKTATLISKQGTEFEPHYCGMHLPKDAPWVDFYWEK